jgi:hypothetical protein
VVGQQQDVLYLAWAILRIRGVFPNLMARVMCMAK